MCSNPCWDVQPSYRWTSAPGQPKALLYPKGDGPQPTKSTFAATSEKPHFSFRFSSSPEMVVLAFGSQTSLKATIMNSKTEIARHHWGEEQRPIFVSMWALSLSHLAAKGFHPCSLTPFTVARICLLAMPDTNTRQDVFAEPDHGWSIHEACWHFGQQFHPCELLASSVIIHHWLGSSTFSIAWWMALELILAGASHHKASRSTMSKSLALFTSLPAAGSPLYSSLSMCCRATLICMPILHLLCSRLVVHFDRHLQGGHALLIYSALVILVAFRIL